MRIKPSQISILVVASTVFIVVVGTRILERMYPVLPTTIAMGVVFLLIIQFKYQDFRASYLIGYIGLSVFYRLFLYLYPMSYTAADSDTYAFNIARLLIDKSPGLGFYSEASGYLETGQILTAITGGSIRIGLSFPAILVGLIFPLSAFLLPRYIQVPYANKVSYLATSITVMSPASVALTVNPIAQAQSAVISLTGIIFLGIYYTYGNKRAIFISLVCLALVLWTHKLAPFLIGASLILSSSAGILYRDKNTNYNKILHIIGICLIISTYLRDSILTQFDRAVVFRSLSLVGIERRSRQPVTQNFEPSIATPIVESQILRVFLNDGFIVLFLGMAGAGWILLSRKSYYDAFARFILSIAALSASLTLAAVLSFTSGGNIRFLFTTVPILSVLAGSVIIYIAGSSSGTSELKMSRHMQRTGLAVLLIMLLIGSQAVSLTASSDSPLEQRAYLDTAELDAKTWGHTHVSTNITTDSFYAGEMPPRQLRAFAQRSKEPPEKYKGRNDWILNGTIAQKANCSIAIRPEIKLYAYNGVWKLTEPIVPDLNNHHKIYSNGQNGANIYRSSRCSDSNTDEIS